MTKTEKNQNNPAKSKKIPIIIGIAAVAVAAIVTVCVIFAKNGYFATTMRLLRVEGTVSVEDSKGAAKPVIDNLRFQSGDSLITGSDGLASVSLDDTKIVTLQNDSRSEFIKNGKQLELKLKQGAVFFNVTEKLRSDEKFEIKTATMTAGIRGTSGIVYYDSEDGYRESLMVTDGVVEVSATNPQNNETRSVKVEGGKSVKVYFYENDTQHDFVEFSIKDIDENDLSRFMLGWMADDEDLLNRISSFTHWDKDSLKKALLGLANDLPAPSSPETAPSADETPAQTPVETPPETSAPSSTSKKPSSKKKPKPKKKTTTRTTYRKPSKKKVRRKSVPKTSKPDASYVLTTR